VNTLNYLRHDDNMFTVCTCRKTTALICMNMMQGALSYVKGNEEVRGGKDEM